jgi:hypothetical protein
MGYGLPDFMLAFSLSTPEFLAQEETFKLYPNPVVDHMIIDANDQKNWQATLSIYDLNGRLVIQKNIEAYDAYRLKLNLEPGVYLLQLTGDINGAYRFQSLSMN